VSSWVEQRNEGLVEIRHDGLRGLVDLIFKRLHPLDEQSQVNGFSRILRKNPAPHVRFPDNSMNNSKNFRSQAAYGIPDRASWHTSRPSPAVSFRKARSG
jgi:hypothetical protein